MSCMEVDGSDGCVSACQRMQAPPAMPRRSFLLQVTSTAIAARQTSDPERDATLELQSSSHGVEVSRCQILGPFTVGFLTHIKANYITLRMHFVINKHKVRLIYSTLPSTSEGTR